MSNEKEQSKQDHPTEEQKNTDKSKKRGENEETGYGRTTDDESTD